MVVRLSAWREVLPDAERVDDCRIRHRPKVEARKSHRHARGTHGLSVSADQAGQQETRRRVYPGRRRDLRRWTVAYLVRSGLGDRGEGHGAWR